MFDQAVINLEHEDEAAHQDEHGEEAHLLLPEPAHRAEFEARAQAVGRGCRRAASAVGDRRRSLGCGGLHRWNHQGDGLDGGGTVGRRGLSGSWVLGQTRQADPQQ